MRALLLTIGLVAVCNNALAQAVGSAAAARTQAAMQNRLADQEAAWNVATKLTNDKSLRQYAKPQSGTDPDSMKTGDTVELGYWNFKVLDVVDKSNLLLILGSKTVIWVENCPTKDLATDQPVRIVDPCKVVGTKQYETTVGSTRTVKVVRMPTAEEVAEQRKAADALAEQKAKEEEDAKYHVWNSKAGTKVTAKLIGWKASKVELQTKEGKKLLVELSAFTAEDGKKLRQMIQEMRDAQKPKDDEKKAKK